MGLSICYLLSAICYFGGRSSKPIGYRVLAMLSAI